MSKIENSIVLFTDGAVSLDVPVSPEKDTVWLNRNQMSLLFNRDVKTIGKHINNALAEELFNLEDARENPTVANFATVQNEGGRQVERSIEYYNLDVIISVGYRVKSKRGIAFRRWANSVLKEYVLKGYAFNKQRLNQLNQVINIISRSDNQEIAAALFVFFLDKNDLLYKANRHPVIDNNALAAMTLMIALSRPEEKDMMCLLVTNMLEGEE